MGQKTRLLCISQNISKTIKDIYTIFADIKASVFTPGLVMCAKNHVNIFGSLLDIWDKKARLTQGLRATPSNEPEIAPFTPLTPKTLA